MTGHVIYRSDSSFGTAIYKEFESTSPAGKKLFKINMSDIGGQQEEVPQ